MSLDGGGVLTVRVKGVPFPIAFADWATRRTLMERLELLARDFTQQVLDIVREEILRVVAPSRQIVPAPPAPSAPPAAAPVTAKAPHRKHGHVQKLPPKALTLRPGIFSKLRRKGPIQLCPVPGCGNRAAPVFGMVCAKHKDVPKSKIKQYRKARRSAKS
jgi:hypothetical protein